MVRSQTLSLMNRVQMMKQKADKMTAKENLHNEHLNNIARGLTFETSDKTDTNEKPAVETQQDDRQKPKAGIKRHSNRKRVIRPSRAKKERVRLATA
jgi:hypothetical protein